ncbi:helix-turn-helix domain-containing protein [Jonquetella anthropi]|uniref:helix-turn-helix domain-containing protein n=1 Tax=Jonquetella anthropi TaxID=428712 RepID=UPI0001B915CA|nr:LexA family transcriptional regulator [Jonquetella anthropi]EEX48646.1 DNA-binding helix-turn-helix protein [Jonquetella anthropi E3_33 E1]
MNGQELKKRLRAAREAAGVTQKTVSETLGISKMTIVRWESLDAPNEPTASQLVQLASLYGTSVAALTAEATPADKKEAAPDDGTALYPNDPRVIPLTNCRRVPLLSPEATAHCGGGCPFHEITSDATEYILCTPDELGSPIDDLRPPFAVPSEGDCLESVGVYDGDKLIINPAAEIRDFDICVVCWRDSLSAKRICKRNGTIELRSDSGVMIVPEDDIDNGLFSVWGKVISTHRRIRHGI